MFTDTKLVVRRRENWMDLYWITGKTTTDGVCCRRGASGCWRRHKQQKSAAALFVQRSGWDGRNWAGSMKGLVHRSKSSFLQLRSVGRMGLMGTAGQDTAHTVNSHTAAVGTCAH